MIKRLLIFCCFVLMNLMSTIIFAAHNNQTLQLTPMPISDTATTPYDSALVRSEYDPHHFFSADSPVEERAFQQEAHNAMPMTPEQIVRFKKMLDSTKKAAASPPKELPKPTLSTHVVNLAPGATPPVVRLQQGFVTSVVFVDNTGAPWPIQSFDVGNPQVFNVEWQEGSNTLMIQALKMYALGNIAVNLNGLSTPVMLTLTEGQKAVDYRVDLRVSQRGPQAQTSSSLAAVPHQSVNTALLGVLDQVPPKGAEDVPVSGGQADAWLFNDKLYLRTRLILLSPSWSGFMSSPDGMNAYELKKTSTVLVSQNGVPVTLTMGGL